MLDLVFQNSTEDKSFKEDFFVGVLKISAKELNLLDKEIEISMNLVGEDEIRELNNKYRKKDKVTDVLSFPIEEKPLEESGTWPLGDIFICLSFAKNEAKRENVSIDRKIAQLTVHGFLHLLGYDHERSDKDAEEMFELENRILNKLNF
jgi:probable rRNA maturation factor